MTGRLTGQADFIPEPGVLLYREQGVLRFGGHDSAATQSYVFTPNGPAATVTFADGQPFHALDLATGVADVLHGCPPDDYRGRYCVVSPARWQLAWRITGPRKDLCIVTRYTRVSGAIEDDCTATPTR